jgi:hypothetical protein
MRFSPEYPRIPFSRSISRISADLVSSDKNSPARSLVFVNINRILTHLLFLREIEPSSTSNPSSSTSYSFEEKNVFNLPIEGIPNLTDLTGIAKKQDLLGTTMYCSPLLGKTPRSYDRLGFIDTILVSSDKNSPARSLVFVNMNRILTHLLFLG